mgnify:FL=1
MLTKTIEKMHKGNMFSTESMKAQSNASKELAISLLDMGKSAEKAQEKIKTSVWEKAWDGLKSIIGKDVSSVFSKQLTSSVLDGIDSLSKGPVAVETKTALAKILNISDTSSLETFKKKLQEIKPGSQQLKDINKLFDDASIKAGIAASKSQ